MGDDAPLHDAGDARRSQRYCRHQPASDGGLTGGANRRGAALLHHALGHDPRAGARRAQRTLTIWQYLRQNYLANRVFETYEAIVDACCAAWNSLIDQPERITSIATREWTLPVKV
jgi:hypothetical protein